MNPNKNLIKPKLYMNPTKNLIELKLNTIILFVFVLCRVCPKLQVSMDCSFLVAHIVFF